MAQGPPTGVVCSAAVVDICCLFSLSNAITSYGDRYPEGRTEESNSRSKQINQARSMYLLKNACIVRNRSCAEAVVGTDAQKGAQRARLALVSTADATSSELEELSSYCRYPTRTEGRTALSPLPQAACPRRGARTYLSGAG